jgi:hypothetical protein
MSEIKIIKGEASLSEIAAIEKALAKRQSQLGKNNSFGKMENNS